VKKLKVTEESPRRIKELAEDIRILNEEENDVELTTDSKNTIYDFLGTIAEAKQSLEQTKEIVNDT